MASSWSVSHVGSVFACGSISTHGKCQQWHTQICCFCILKVHSLVFDEESKPANTPHLLLTSETQHMATTVEPRDFVFYVFVVLVTKMLDLSFIQFSVCKDESLPFRRHGPVWDCDSIITLCKKFFTTTYKALKCAIIKCVGIKQTTLFYLLIK